MIGALLLRLSNLITPDNVAVFEAAEEAVSSGRIGFIVLAVILGPVLILTIASIFGRPRTYRVPALFLGSLILLIGAMILGFALGDVLLDFVVPQ